MEIKPRETWDEYFMGLANKVRSRSKDRATKVGAVVVGPDKEIRSTGYNGFPRGIDDSVPERHKRPAKYHFTIHAEENAIVNAARVGTPTEGCTIYVTTRPCCSRCAGCIVNAGIVEVVLETTEPSRRPDGDSWAMQWEFAKQMFVESGVRFRKVNE